MIINTLDYAGFGFGYLDFGSTIFPCHIRIIISLPEPSAPKNAIAIIEPLKTTTERTWGAKLEEGQ